MIELKNIKKTYSTGSVNTVVLKGISFSIKAGEYVAIMGASGTGKSTLMNVIGCMDKATEGRYLLENVDVTNLRDDSVSHIRNEKIGFVFQKFHLLERTSSLKNVMLPLIYSAEYPEDAEQRAKNTLSEVGLEDRMNYTPDKLSGGQQQRVAIARALITNPHIIIADEPTGNLDAQSGLEILAIFKRLHQENRTIIVVTHDQAVAEHTDRILVLKDGIISEDRKVTKPLNASEELQNLHSSGDGESKS